MKSNFKFITAVLAAAFGTAMVAQIASAGTAAKSETEQAGEAKSSGIKVPVDAKHILNGVRGARLALFDGNIEMARELIADTSGQFDEHVAKFAVKISEADRFGFPVDSGLQFVEGFEPSDGHGLAISEVGHISDAAMLPWRLK